MNENDSVLAITNLYKKILKREPDKTGLYFFVAQLKTKDLTLEDIDPSLMRQNH